MLLSSSLIECISGEFGDIIYNFRIVHHGGEFILIRSVSVDCRYVCPTDSIMFSTLHN